MNRQDELKNALLQSLTSPNGVIYKIDGDQANQRQAAMAALITAKRELLPDEPDLINVRIQFVPGAPNEIAIVYLKTVPHG